MKAAAIRRIVLGANIAHLLSIDQNPSKRAKQLKYQFPVLMFVVGSCVTNCSVLRAEDFSSCTGIKIDQKRLECFDEKTKNKPGGAAVNSQEPMNVSDVMADAKELKGKRVTVGGYALTLGETVILYEKQGSMSGLFVDISKLTRDQRRPLFKSCGDGCEATVPAVLAL